MFVIQEMKKISIVTVALFMVLGLKAQDNPTALLKKMEVKQIEKYIYVHAFSGKKDTCLYYHQELDEEYRTSFERVDMRCYGFNEVDEYTYIYGKKGLKKMVHDKLDGPFSVTNYQNDTAGQPVEMNSFFFRTNDSSETFTTYFYGEGAMPDSSVTTFISQEGDTVYTKTIARFNEDGNAVQLITVDEDREVTQQLSYEYKDSLVASVANTVYGERSDFMQTFYDYDQDGRIVVTYNTVNQRQEYFYDKNGLLSNIMNYNPKGDLESEVIFKYEYR